MSSSPLVSVITNFLDGERFLQEAIDSVFTQTYANWELLLVNDGSGPAATDIARRCTAQHADRVRYLEHPGGVNRGMSASRNLGVSNARGEFIALLDADDIFLPEKLAEQVAILQSNPNVAMVWGPTLKWFSWDPSATETDRVQRFGVTLDQIIEPPEMVRQWVNRSGGNPGTCALLVRASAAREVGMFEEIFTGMYEDQVFGTKICLRWPVYVSSRTWCRYRQHPASTCALTDENGLMPQAWLRFLMWMRGYIASQGFEGTPLWRDLQRAIWPLEHPALNRVIQPARVIKRDVQQALAKSVRRLKGVIG